MKVLLRTRCGCERVMEARANTYTIRVSIIPDLKLSREPQTPDPIPYREFEFRGQWKGTKRIFLEVM